MLCSGEQRGQVLFSGCEGFGHDGVSCAYAAHIGRLERETPENAAHSGIARGQGVVRVRVMFGGWAVTGLWVQW